MKHKFDDEVLPLLRGIRQEINTVSGQVEGIQAKIQEEIERAAVSVERQMNSAIDVRLGHWLRTIRAGNRLLAARRRKMKPRRKSKR